MKRRSSAIFGSISVVILGIFFVILRLDIGDIPTPKAEAHGEILSAVALKDDERIEFDYSASGCGTWDNWTFVLLGGSEYRMAVIDAGGSWRRGHTTSNQASPIGALTLSRTERKGLEALLRLYRQPDLGGSSTSTTQIHVSYYRGSDMVGAEEFVDRGSVDYLIFERNRSEQIDPSSRMTPEIVTFFQLMRRATEANQASEPTAASGRGSL